jgi:hypothetical protein
MKVLAMSLLLLGGTFSFAYDSIIEDEIDSIEIIADTSGADPIDQPNPPANNPRTMTPAERQDNKIEKGANQQDILSSPRAKAQSKMFPSPEYEETYKSLSPKNRVVFDALSKQDQQKVVNSYLNGEDPQKIMMKILQRDQRAYNKEKDGAEDWDASPNRNSPANRSMQSPSKRNDVGPESEIFEPGIQ